MSKRALPAYKILEPNIQNKDFYIPNRINRGILEITGRILGQQGDRESVFSSLLECERDLQKWSFNLLKEKKNLYEKSQYIENIKEQTANYISLHGKFPKDYFSMTKVPQLKRGMISYAPDDGQALRFSTSHKRGSATALSTETMEVEMKVVKTTQPKTPKDWEWISFSIPLFEKISTKRGSATALSTKRGSATALSKDYASFDLRCGTVHNLQCPILDIKVKVEPIEKKETGNFIVVDWGQRKLITLCVFNKKGEQISPPFFLKCSPLQRKLFRIRTEIDCLKSKRDKLPYQSTLWRWYNREVAKRWNKFRQIQKQLSHLASNVIILIATLFSCDSIYVEWLKSLKSSSKSHNTNWKINSQVRQAIYEKVQYKASAYGISFKRPISAGYTSQFCPKCGKKGHHISSPDRLLEKIKSGSWFYCPHCQYNADRDYVACQNLARRALFGNKLKDLSKTFAYTTKVISDKLFRQSIEEYSKLRHCLNGWKNSVFLRPIFLLGRNSVFLKPVIFGAGTLRI